MSSIFMYRVFQTLYHPKSPCTPFPLHLTVTLAVSFWIHTLLIGARVVKSLTLAHTYTQKQRMWVCAYVYMLRRCAYVIVRRKRSGMLYSVSSSPGSDVPCFFEKRISTLGAPSEIAHTKTKSVCTRLQAASACLRYCQEMMRRSIDVCLTAIT